MALDKDLHDNIVLNTFSLTPDSNTEYKFEIACNAVTQFQLTSNAVKVGLEKLFHQYDSLEFSTKRALLETTYGVYSNAFNEPVQQVFSKETQPLLFAMAAAYLFRNNPSIANVDNIKIRMVEQFPGYDTIAVLAELEKYLDGHEKQVQEKTPDLKSLFEYSRSKGQKSIYSFQRWNRDYPGLAIVQNADGSFIRHPDGRLMIFEQLARSGSDLPYFITNGSTPQGVYSILGTGVSNNKLIGPTPNLQLLMPFEGKWENYFQLLQDQVWDTTKDVLDACEQLLPPSWRKYGPMKETFYAGKIGRTEIIAHGSTIDPEYFKDKPYYPLTPTLGCLCAKELWNVSNGYLLVSEQFNLVSAFTSTPGSKGYLYVINLDDQQKPVTREEVEYLLKK